MIPKCIHTTIASSNTPHIEQSGTPECIFDDANEHLHHLDTILAYPATTAI